MPFQQRTNTSCYLAIPTRGFTAVVSVFGGTPPPKPLICKIRFALPGDAIGALRAHHTGDDCLRAAAMLAFAMLDLSPENITWMSLYSYSQIVCLSLQSLIFQFLRENKKPCLHAVSRVRKVSFDSLPAYHKSIQIDFGFLP
jgi:hypothetical protein